MSQGYVLYNPIAGNREYADNIDLLEIVFGMVLNFVDITEITDYSEIMGALQPEDFLVLCGGDGTLNRFVNDTKDYDIKNVIYYVPSGSGNDFALDMNRSKGCDPFVINKQLKKLPSVTVNDKTFRFINGVGFGIDGYCCEIGDEQREFSTKPINYTAIAIKGLLFHYKPTKAKIIVDGKTYNYNNVWLAPTMFGRYYGGGMMPAPDQSRDKSYLSVMVYHSKSKLKALCAFPSIFKGNHVKYKKMVSVHSGKNITVEYECHRSLQIDGETIKNVKSYTAVI